MISPYLPICFIYILLLLLYVYYNYYYYYYYYYYNIINMHPLTCVMYAAAALALGPAQSVTVPRGAASEYRICVSIIISAYGTTLTLVVLCSCTDLERTASCIASAGHAWAVPVSDMRGALLVSLATPLRYAERVWALHRYRLVSMEFVNKKPGNKK